VRLVVAGLATGTHAHVGAPNQRRFAIRILAQQNGPVGRDATPPHPRRRDGDLVPARHGRCRGRHEHPPDHAAGIFAAASPASISAALASTRRTIWSTMPSSSTVWSVIPDR